ncbi:MAG: terminase small subunit [Candidatus Acidiferrales bacterium]
MVNQSSHRAFQTQGRMPTAEKRKRFAEEYAVDCNGTQAAVRAGYSPKTASAQASRLLRNAKVRAAIEGLLAEETRRAELTADEIINGIRETVRRCQAPGKDFQPFAVLKGYELLGKYKKLWTEKTEVTGDADLIERLMAGRKRLQQSPS